MVRVLISSDGRVLDPEIKQEDTCLKNGMLAESDETTPTHPWTFIPVSRGKEETKRQVIAKQEAESMPEKRKVPQLRATQEAAAREEEAEKARMERVWQERHEALVRQRLADREIIQQQERLLRQAREEVTERDRRHREELDRLYSKLDALQIGSSKLVGDDLIVNQMRRLNQLLDNWVNFNFKDRRAWVHATVANLIHAEIFKPYHFGLPDDPLGDFLSKIERNVRGNCSENELDVWRVATSVAIQASSNRRSELVIRSVVQGAERILRDFSSTQEVSRQGQLRGLLWKCATLKLALSRQKQRFFFCCSPLGVMFDPQSMILGGGDGQPASIVRWSLWPAIVKTVDQRGCVLEPELVWTMES
ncbi:hypothetical protein BO82DRAFT_396978 [Aspergillus uvarum CBS 121591]|uniref:Uncharacterized protein n=1 Tax=Aspergillus uvarum CBS 121591 TaxID=1448315 RepID=A0A319E7J1_9EURO|nr:hypothetical protein BO82DRAFT_396978 [Aspergillus uvarum CBS 121591]PYH87042.1 hypothetical protein BO82DRAFT_396978 [Aspergillus uvarum CBS 121591]